MVQCNKSIADIIAKNMNLKYSYRQYLQIINDGEACSNIIFTENVQCEILLVLFIFTLNNFGQIIKSFFIGCQNNTNKKRIQTLI